MLLLPNYPYFLRFLLLTFIINSFELNLFYYVIDESFLSINLIKILFILVQLIDRNKIKHKIYVVLLG